MRRSRCRSLQTFVAPAQAGAHGPGFRPRDTATTDRPGGLRRYDAVGKSALFALALIASCAASATDRSRSLDRLDDASAWTAAHTDDVSAAVSKGPDGGLCLAFDFHGVSGSASMRRTLPVDFPAGFALSFRVKGHMPPNTLQLKFIDDSGDNVWWHQTPGFVPSTAWKPLDITSRQVEFAWGPVKDRTLRRTRDVEFMVYKEAQPKGVADAGEVCFDDLRLTPRAPEAVPVPPPTPNAMIEARAKGVRRGLYPRGFSGEQSYWTIVGVDGGSRDSALISEDGAVETTRGGFSIEPFLIDGGRLVTWADVETTQSLRDGYLPMPSVTWKRGALSLTTTAFAEGHPGSSSLILAYRIANDGATARDVTLALAARPFQVNPPTQFLNAPGGIAAIHDMAWDGRSLTVDGTRKLIPLQPTTCFVPASPADLMKAGCAGDGGMSRVPSPTASAPTRAHNADGLAQGALLYRVHVPARGHVDLGVVVPSQPGTSFARPGNASAWLAEHADAVASRWRDTLDRVSITVPKVAQPIVDTMKSGIAQILMSRDGPALQPGTRSYSRTWIRDGAMMLEGLLRTGHEDVAGEFVRWYAPHQFSNGKVPCCVDARGSDPVPENDSHGELVFAIAELWRYTHDRAAAKALYPHVRKAVAYMDALRASERQPLPLYGLMPASISHEGYSAKPMHSYWDDFWALKGYDDATDLAQALGRDDDAKAFGASRDAFRTDLHASIAAAVKRKGIDFIPGAAELGDFDATSTTIAVSPGGEQSRLPQPLLHRTFEKYWEDFVARRDGKRDWDDYTPYELRTVATFVRLGWRDRVTALLDFFFADRRPAAWNQWAEVVGRDPRKPRFVGDMPHAWIASDYVRSALDLFAYERDADHAVVLAAGVRPAWLEGDGIAVRDLRTPYGRLGYTLKAKGGVVELVVTQPIEPPGGLVLSLPSREVTVGGGSTRLDVTLP
ncbi:discoidin domain-containing protein [Luteibacter sp. CQ10]|uniref:discoidin domain-containing protein n=1 Tax=Luteibacter sp. CQ10 TaxID=2805821 RepID=UPI0034A375D9